MCNKRVHKGIELTLDQIDGMISDLTNGVAIHNLDLMIHLRNMKNRLETAKRQPACNSGSCIKCTTEAEAPLSQKTFRFACETCGNKRCSHHSDHTSECTNSNESGQKGSIYV